MYLMTFLTSRDQKQLLFIKITQILQRNEIRKGPIVFVLMKSIMITIRSKKKLKKQSSINRI